MKTRTKALLTAAGLMLGVTAVNAATTFNAAAGSTLNDDANWTNNQPVGSTNLGTVNVNTVWDTGTTLTNWHVDFTGGDISTNSTGTRTFSGGIQTFSGGNLTGGNRIFSTSGGALTTIESGSTVGLGTLSVGGSTFVVDGGSLNVTNVSGGAGLLNINGTGTVFTINSGTVNAPAVFGNNATTSDTTNIWNFNGGTLTAGTLRYRSVAQMRLGGTTPGSATFTNGYATSNHSDDNIRIDWLSGSLMTLTIGVDDWAKTNWDAGRMTYFNGSSTINNTNYTWAQVTTTGFGDGNGFNLDGNTLSLVVIPEPSTLVLFGIAGLAAMGFLRRRK